MTAEFPDFYLVNVYVPNAGEGLKRLDYRVGEWDAAFAAYAKGLEAKDKPVIVTGDLNVAQHVSCSLCSCMLFWGVIMASRHWLQMLPISLTGRLNVTQHLS